MIKAEDSDNNSTNTKNVTTRGDTESKRHIVRGPKNKGRGEEMIFWIEFVQLFFFEI